MAKIQELVNNPSFAALRERMLQNPQMIQQFIQQI